MSKKTVLIVLIVVLLGAAAAYIVFGSDEASAPEQQSATSASSETTVNKPADAPEATSETVAGMYVDYSDDVIAKTSGIKLLFFHAPWCPQCRAIDEGISTDTIPDGVTVIKVDYDSNQALRQKYGVTIQTTFVRVDDEGNLVEKYVAYDEPTFDSVKENLL